MEVKVYTTTTCPYCRLLKTYLAEKNVAFAEIVLDQHPKETQAFLDTCGSMGVPCTHIVKDDGTELSILGFDKEKISKELGIT